MRCYSSPLKVVSKPVRELITQVLCCNDSYQYSLYFLFFPFCFLLCALAFRNLYWLILGVLKWHLIFFSIYFQNSRLTPKEFKEQWLTGDDQIFGRTCEYYLVCPVVDYRTSLFIVLMLNLCCFRMYIMWIWGKSIHRNRTTRVYACYRSLIMLQIEPMQMADTVMVPEVDSKLVYDLLSGSITCLHPSHTKRSVNTFCSTM